jgi:hypothetical protein
MDALSTYQNMYCYCPLEIGSLYFFAILLRNGATEGEAIVSYGDVVHSASVLWHRCYNKDNNNRSHSKMPIRLSTTVQKIFSLPNKANSLLLNKFYEYMKSNCVSESHQNNNLKVSSSVRSFLLQQIIDVSLETFNADTLLLICCRVLY